MAEALTVPLPERRAQVISKVRSVGRGLVEREPERGMLPLQRGSDEEAVHELTLPEVHVKVEVALTLTDPGLADKVTNAVPVTGTTSTVTESDIFPPETLSQVISNKVVAERGPTTRVPEDGTEPFQSGSVEDATQEVALREVHVKVVVAFCDTIRGIAVRSRPLKGVGVEESPQVAELALELEEPEELSPDTALPEVVPEEEADDPSPEHSDELPETEEEEE